jgi:outer membrane protein assembly factor BamB
MYMITGNDDVLALNAKTGEIVWQRWSWIDQKDVGRMLRLAEPRAGNG